jgi:hypothetical protein
MIVPMLWQQQSCMPVRREASDLLVYEFMAFGGNSEALRR